MKETDLQSKCLTAMREMGGFAQKMSNRFLIGVPDLMFKLPRYSTSFWEVKRRPTAHQNPDPSPKQKLWLRDYTRAGGFCGVINFISKDNEMAFAIKLSTDFDYEDLKKVWWVKEEDYVQLPRGCKMVPFKEEMLKTLMRQGEA